MTTPFRMRLGLLVLGIVVVAALILSSVQISWRRIMDVERKLTTSQFESFQIAEAFRRHLLALDNAFLRYAGRRDPVAWKAFEEASSQLNRWMDRYDPTHQEPRDAPASDLERRLFQQLKTVYDRYLAAANRLHTNQHPEGVSSDRIADVEVFEAQFRSLLELGESLAEAHGAAQKTFLNAANASLQRVRWWLVVLLGILLGLVGAVGWVLYRDLIAPLRTRLVRSEALLQRQEKLATLGTLAAGIAHEIRNPLTSIKARLYTLGKHIQDNQAGRNDAGIISSEITRLEQIVQSVLQFARPSEPKLAVVQADVPLRAVQTLMGASLERNRLRLVVEPGPALPVTMDVALIKEVLINLVRNAAEAMEQDGVITLRVRTGEVALQNRPAAVAILEVADTGPGIAPEVEKRLFDPFFSTKETGTGLGLSISARIVEKHGGLLQYQTQPGHGTTFGIVLPLASPDDNLTPAHGD